MKSWQSVAVVCGIVLFGGAEVFGADRKADSPSSQRYELVYRVDLSALPKDARRVHLWVPTPAKTPFQHVEKIEIESGWLHLISQDDLGNRVVYFEGSGALAPSEIMLRFVVRRDAIEGPYRSSKDATGSLIPHRFRQPSKMIPLRGAIRLLSERLSRGISSDGQKIRAFYDHVVGHMKYSKTGKRWGHGDAEWACESKYGNCTDFHSVLIGLARCQKLAARFVIGFPIPAAPSGNIGGYHCWAELYAPTLGWLPVDASEAYKQGAPDDYFAKLPPDRVQFTTGRDLVLVPPQAGPPLNFFVYPYAEIDGVGATWKAWSLSFTRLPS